MLIINADDWGRTIEETDATLRCHQHGRVTSISAMLFMRDSERAADLAKAHGVDSGLHLNLSQSYAGNISSPAAAKAHEKIVRYMRSKYAVLLFHPGLQRDLSIVFKSQWEEFCRLYGQAPSHVDGHQHRHLWANLLIKPLVPRGQKVRRSFSFWPGEKSTINRIYRGTVDRLLGRRYRLTDYFFSLGQCLGSQRLERVASLAQTANVELMTHAIHPQEQSWLLSDDFDQQFQGINIGSYVAL